MLGTLSPSFFFVLSTINRYLIFKLQISSTTTKEKVKVKYRQFQFLYSWICFQVLISESTHNVYNFFWLPNDPINCLKMGLIVRNFSFMFGTLFGIYVAQNYYVPDIKNLVNQTLTRAKQVEERYRKSN